VALELLAGFPDLLAAISLTTSDTFQKPRVEGRQRPAPQHQRESLRVLDRRQKAARGECT